MFLNFANKIKKLDIVDPQVLSIEGRCYRNLQSHDGIVSFYNNIYSAPAELCLCEDEDLDIFELSNDLYQLSLTIPRSSHHLIIGHLGKTLCRLRTDSGCHIDIPKLQEESDTVVISGTSRKAIKSVRNRIEIILSRTSGVYDIPEVTHFISIPISSYEIVDRLGEFKRCIMETSDLGIDKSIFQDPSKLHLTICTLNLQSKEDLSKALGIFTTQVQHILNNSISEETIIQLKGTECMNDDPSDVHVLYALAEMVGSDITLQTLCDQICKLYEEISLSNVKKGRSSTKIHVTLMNSKKRHFELSKDVKSQQRTPRIPFDARYILEKYNSDFLFGNSALKEIHFSDINNLNPSTGYYQELEVIKF